MENNIVEVYFSVGSNWTGFASYSGKLNSDSAVIQIEKNRGYYGKTLKNKTMSKRKWKRFTSKIQNIVLDWQNSYGEYAMDGFLWSLCLIYSNNTGKAYSGCMDVPYNWKKLRRIIRISV